MPISRHTLFRFVKGRNILALSMGFLVLSGCSTFYESSSSQKSSIYSAVDKMDLSAKQGSSSGSESDMTGGIRLHSETYLADEGEAPQSPVSSESSGQTVDEARFDIDMQSMPVETAARAILADILKQTYMVDPRVQGTITLASGRPIPRKLLISAFEAALQSIGAALVKDQDGYRIIPAGDALGQGRISNSALNEPGYGITVLPLSHVSADTMQRLLDGFASKPGLVRTLPSRNLLVVQGSSLDRQAVIETAFAFDQDWMKGQSVGIYSLGSSTPDAVIAELRNIFEAGDGGTNSGLIQFQPIVRMNGVLVIAKRSDLLKRAATWITRLDKADNSSTAARVYRVKYGDAKQLAGILNDAFGNGGASAYSVDTVRDAGLGAGMEASLNGMTSGQSGAGSSASAQSSDPNASQGQRAASGGVFGGNASGSSDGNSSSSAFGANATQNNSSGMGNGGASREGQGRVRITADTNTNSLLIFADQESAAMVFKVIEQIDRPRLQVAIEATIAEVTLNNSLQYGVQYYLKNNVGSIGLATSKMGSEGNQTPLVKTLPGFNLLLGSETDPKAILTALSGRTNVKVLSTPSLVVLDNQPATLQVGDQVPVSTTQATLVTGGDTANGFPVANNIDYRNTGVILRVLPRVAANGNVTLDVDQEISNVANATSDGTLTPTISQRRVKSSIAVTSGQTVLLAGLISDREQSGREGIPWLERITLLGDLFASNTSTLNRTELIIFIKPQIIQDAVDAQAIAEEMRAKMTSKGPAN